MALMRLDVLLMINTATTEKIVVQSIRLSSKMHRDLSAALSRIAKK
jgi:hypothetical protein